MLAIDSVAVSLCSEKEGRLTVSLEDYVQYTMIHLCDWSIIKHALFVLWQPCREWPLKLITKWEGTEDHFKFVSDIILKVNFIPLLSLQTS